MYVFAVYVIAISVASITVARWLGAFLWRQFLNTYDYKCIRVESLYHQIDLLMLRKNLSDTHLNHYAKYAFSQR